MHVCAQYTVRPNTLKHQGLGQRKVYCKAIQGDGWLTPQTPNSLKDFSKAFFKGQEREKVWLVVANFLVLESCVLATALLG